MDNKILFGLAGIAFGVIAYFPYIKDTLKGKTKPHTFTWLIWGTMEVIVCAGQVTDGAGPGAWVTGLSATFSYIILLLSLRHGEKKITFGDWLSLAGACMALILWYLTRSPLWSVILVTVIDLFAYIPTYRKSYYKPTEETFITYVFALFKLSCAIIALRHYSIITVLYPAALLLANVSFLVLVTVRKKVIANFSAS